MSDESITLPLSPNEDTEITCIYCRAPRPCEYGLTVLRAGERALLGIHATCLDPLRKRTVARPFQGEAGIVSVRGVEEDGPWILFLGEYGVAIWPSKPANEDPKGYAEAVAEAVRRALADREFGPLAEGKR